MRGKSLQHLLEGVQKWQVDRSRGTQIRKIQLISNSLRHTFISPFESSPVHCLKRRPCGNPRRRENGGTRASLIKNERDFRCKEEKLCKIYLWSMSSNTVAAPALPYSSTRNFSTQVTKWSLKVPLMTWWRMSGAISSCMSARGKSFVNGYRTKF